MEYALVLIGMLLVVMVASIALNLWFEYCKYKELNELTEEAEAFLRELEARDDEAEEDASDAKRSMQRIYD